MEEGKAPFVYVLGKPNHNPEPVNKIGQEYLDNSVNANTRNQHAIARQNEAQLFLMGLQEIRSALSAASLAEGDTGTSERPPIDAAFFEAERGMLQTEYRKLFSKYQKYVDHVMKTELLS